MMDNIVIWAVWLSISFGAWLVLSADLWAKYGIEMEMKVRRQVLLTLKCLLWPLVAVGYITWGLYRWVRWEFAKWSRREDEVTEFDRIFKQVESEARRRDQQDSHR